MPLLFLLLIPVIFITATQVSAVSFVLVTLGKAFLWFLGALFVITSFTMIFD